MQLVSGRDFSKELARDSTEAFILNEAAVALIGWKSAETAIGSRFALLGNSLQRSGTIIGVVADFHFESLRERISPLVMFIMPERYRRITVKVAGVDLERELEFLEHRWAEYDPEVPFRASFVDQNFGALYAAEKQLGEVFALFAALAVFIACLGLFGLASFVTERRSKEIGIRKVLGASVGSIVVTLSRGFLVHVLLAFLVAVPLTILVMQWWLGGFAYNVGFDPGVFLLAGLAVVLIAFLTVGYQSLRTALANPVTSLRDE